MMKSKKSSYKFWHSPIALFFLLCIIIFFGYKLVSLIEKQRETTHKKELLQNQIINLQAKEASLTMDISKLETDDGKEEIIRSKYQLIKNGEKMVTIVDEENKDESLPKEEIVSHGFWNWVKGIFNN